MIERKTRTAPVRRLSRFVAGASVVAVVLGPLVALDGAASASSSPIIRAAVIANYPSVLENHASRTLYLLSVEKGAKLHCTSKACLATWLPLLVTTATKSIAVQASVKGKIGFVTRSKTLKQVTVNTYPVYTYVHDTGAGQSHGESVAADGGTWLMLRSSATTAAATPVPALLQADTAGAYAGSLANSTHLTLYALSTEQGGTLHCTGGCLNTWPPLYVSASTTAVSVGAGVKGKIGFITRGTQKQVTFNSYPVYVFSGDSGPNQSNGEHLVDPFGTWYIASAGATTPGTTLTPPK